MKPDYFLLDMQNIHQILNNYYYYNFENIDMKGKEDLAQVMSTLRKYINRQDDDFDDFREE